VLSYYGDGEAALGERRRSRESDQASANDDYISGQVVRLF
jgi:hypothetical protein